MESSSEMIGNQTAPHTLAPGEIEESSAPSAPPPEESDSDEELTEKDEDDTPCPGRERKRHHRFLKVLKYMERQSMSVEEFIDILHSYDGIIPGSTRYRTKNNRQKVCCEILEQLIVSSPDI